MDTVLATVGTFLHSNFCLNSDKTTELFQIVLLFVRIYLDFYVVPLRTCHTRRLLRKQIVPEQQLLLASTKTEVGDGEA